MLAATGAALALVAAPVASVADVGLYFSRLSGSPGTLVYARTAAGYSTQPSWPVLLVSGAGNIDACPGAHCPSPRLAHPPRGRRYTPLGRLSFRRGHQGRIRFVVPRVRPGWYWVGVWCPPCYKGPGGSLVITGPRFRVLP